MNSASESGGRLSLALPLQMFGGLGGVCRFLQAIVSHSTMRTSHATCMIEALPKRGRIAAAAGSFRDASPALHSRIVARAQE